MCHKGKVRKKKHKERERGGEKERKISQYRPCCTCIHLQCLHILGCKYVYKGNLLPFSETDLEASKQPFHKVHYRQRGYTLSPRTEGRKKTKQKVSAISLSTKYNCNVAEIIVEA